MNKRTHISIPEEIDFKINNYANKVGLKYSQAVSKLVEIGLSNIELTESINSYVGILDRVFSKLCYNTALLEQFYSDLEIDTLTNPNNNLALKKFRNKINKNTISE